MDLSVEIAIAEDSASAPESEPMSMSADQAREASARLFRSLKAGRSWVRAREASAAPPNSPCVPMKPGNDEPPVFMIPGAPGSILQLGGVASALPIPAPVYAIKPRGLDEGETPYETIPEMAAYAIAAMRALRPNGPYYLIGYSAGGLVALEMAHQLAEAGHEVPLLVFLDTYPGWQFWPHRYHAEVMLRQIFRGFWSLRKYSPSQAVREVVDGARGLIGRAVMSARRKQPEAPPAEGWSAASRRVHIATFNAGEAYRPAHYDGNVVFIQPERLESMVPRVPTRLWREYLPHLEARVVPTSHLGLVEDGADATAAAVGKSLEQAAERRQSVAGAEAGGEHNTSAQLPELAMGAR